MARTKRDHPWMECRDNGVFYAYRYDPAKRRTFRESLTTRDPAEAARKFGHVLLRKHQIGAQEHAGLTVRAVLQDYLREHVEHSDDKGRPYVADQRRQKTIIAHLTAHFQDTPIAAIGPAHSRGYADVRRKGEIGGGKRHPDKKGSDSTIRRELNCLVAAANHAIKWKRLSPADMPQVELPSEGDSGDLKWLTKEQVKTLLDAAIGEFDLDLHAFIAIAYYTGARRRSIQDLTKFQVDLPNSRIHLMPPEARATKKRKPVVPIYPEIRPVVERLCLKATDRLFPRTRDFYRPFATLARDVLKVEAWPHMLRHSRATHLLMDGESIYRVARLLGDTVATVERVYGHSDPEFLAMTKEAGQT